MISDVQTFYCSPFCAWEVFFTFISEFSKKRYGALCGWLTWSTKCRKYLMFTLFLIFLWTGSNQPWLCMSKYLSDNFKGKSFNLHHNLETPTLYIIPKFWIMFIIIFQTLHIILTKYFCHFSNFLVRFYE